MENYQDYSGMDQPEVQVMKIDSAETLAALNRSEIDIQVATAKQYPRNLARVLTTIETLATMDEEIAQSCFYVLSRQGKRIEGPSIRMAEIIASSWGNLRVATRIVGNDGKMLTAQGVCHDLETNFAVSKEVKRKITDKKGRTFSEDMQVVTGNAASSVAFRNAVMAVVPSALIKKVLAKAKEVSLGKGMTMEQRRQNLIAAYQKIGVEQKTLLDYLSIDKAEELDTDMLIDLRGTLNAIKEGTTTVEDTFFPKSAAGSVNTEEVNPAKDLFGRDKEKAV